MRGILIFVLLFGMYVNNANQCLILNFMIESREKKAFKSFEFRAYVAKNFIFCEADIRI